MHGSYVKARRFQYTPLGFTAPCCESESSTSTVSGKSGSGRLGGGGDPLFDFGPEDGFGTVDFTAGGDGYMVGITASLGVKFSDSSGNVGQIVGGTSSSSTVLTGSAIAACVSNVSGCLSGSIISGTAVASAGGFPAQKVPLDSAKCGAP